MAGRYTKPEDNPLNKIQEILQILGNPRYDPSADPALHQKLSSQLKKLVYSTPKALRDEQHRNVLADYLPKESVLPEKYYQKLLRLRNDQKLAMIQELNRERPEFYHMVKQYVMNLPDPNSNIYKMFSEESFYPMYMNPEQALDSLLSMQNPETIKRIIEHHEKTDPDFGDKVRELAIQKSRDGILLPIFPTTFRLASVLQIRPEGRLILRRLFNG